MFEPLSISASRAGYAALYAYGCQTNAVSAEASEMGAKADALVKFAEGSRALFETKANAINDLRALALDWLEQVREHGDPTIDPASLENVESFIRALPNEVAMPEVSVEPDGCISLDWIRSRHRMLSLSIGTTARIAYAWLDGTDRGHGVASFNGATVPRDILSHLEALVGIEDASVRAA
jgi:hypothetical protein